MTASFPFVVGSERSGTALVRTLLDSHPDLAIPGESHFIPQMSHLAGFLDVVFSDQFVRQWGLPEAHVRARFAGEPPASYADAVRLLYACYAESRGKPRYGDQTPPYVRHLPLLSSLFPEARFVHVIRDGRDVAGALVAAEGYSGTLEEAAEHWRDAVEDGRRVGAELGVGRYLELPYEALVADPDAGWRRLCEFVDLPYAPSAITVDAGRRDWRTDMDAVDAGVVWLLAGRLLAELGYPPDERSIPAEARARVMRHQARTAARKVRRRLGR